ncbi:MAG: formylglycine-generating enzyme family protein [Bacteroidetes bacterium]|nr:formylglycine-generating enzyme family protein [Bacteroidota bacterium]MBU1717505.1 formylglycine-generating enzyme family protein [Bacteroidota bacterium]
MKFRSFCTYCPIIFSALVISGCNSDETVRPEIEWVKIPAGSFLMGSPDDEGGRSEDETQHKVAVEAFSMSKYEITFEQFDKFCEATKREKPTDESWGRGNLPVINVSWEDANAFAEWMNCRLPTEAEWEYACRAGTSTAFSTGTCIGTAEANINASDSYNECPIGNCVERTKPVGSYGPNPFDLYDMHGNVWEWCNDWYGQYKTDRSSIDEGETSRMKVFRGGGWFFKTKFCRSAARYSRETGFRSRNVGFRLVKS